MTKIRIVIADDHPMMREALVTALEDEASFEIVGEAENGIEAIQLAEKLKPDIVLMDLLMPGMDGLEAISKLLEIQPEAKILVVTSLEDQEKVIAAVQAGALGYFPKTAPRTYLLEAIKKVADGIPYLPSGIAKKLFQGIRELKTRPHTINPQETILTPRQEEILSLLGEGRTDREISEILHLSEATVRSHVHSIVQRLGVDNRAQAVAYAHRQEE